MPLYCVVALFKHRFFLPAHRQRLHNSFIGRISTFTSSSSPRHAYFSMIACSLNISCTFYYVPRPYRDSKEWYKPTVWLDSMGKIRIFVHISIHIYCCCRSCTVQYAQGVISVVAPWANLRIATVCYAEGLWRMRRHGPVTAHCTDSEDFPHHVATFTR